MSVKTRSRLIIALLGIIAGVSTTTTVQAFHVPRPIIDGIACGHDSIKDPRGPLSCVTCCGGDKPSDRPTCNAICKDIYFLSVE